MARPQSADYDDKRDAILDGAASLFAERGFHAASIADVASACGISKSALYHYYPSKEDVLFAIMQDHVAKLARAAVDALSGEGGAEEKLRALCHGFMQLYVCAQDRHVVLLNELSALPEPRRADIVAAQRGLVDQVWSLLAQLRPDLAGRIEARRPIAMAFFGMINWTYTWWRADGAMSADTFADLAVDIFLRGLQRLDDARPPTPANNGEPE